MTTDRVNKVMPLKQAIERFVTDGCHMSIGGFTINRNPMAAVYEIIRRKKRNLHLYAHSNGQGVDELTGAGAVSRLEIAYGGNGRFAPTCIRFKKAVQEGRIAIEDYSNFQMTLRFLAGALGVPFLPTRSGMGSDILAKWGFSEEIRSQDPGLPDKKALVLDNPFGDWAGSSKVVLVPAICPDVTIIHAQKAATDGTTRISGLSFTDVEQAKAAEHVIVTCEELLTPDNLRDDADLNRIPPFCVDAVCHVPYGAYPTACYGYYDYDPVYLKEYARLARDDERYRVYLEKYIFDPPDHQRFIEALGTERMEGIKADPRTGYARNLDRR
ncbi:MAG: CoA transferase subunit A [Deltaproteobacteria bacterium]|nr:CoA transferase subunit A [Deltaproteobacteria bacterium]